MSVEEAAEQLYALPPEEFIAARAAAAKADPVNRKAITALRRPTVGAWLVNALARSEPALLDQLLALGPALADAQRSGQGDELRALGGQRRDLVAAVTDRAFEVASRERSAAARAEVESTLEAALADPATAKAVRSGRLTRALSYAGFGGVDLEGAVAVGVSGPARRGVPPTKTPAAQRSGRQAPTKAGAAERTTRPRSMARSTDIAAAETRAQDAAGVLDDAVRACQLARSELDAAQQADEAATADVSAAEAALRAARDGQALAQQRARQARHRSEQATSAVDQAQTRAEKARRALDRLRRE